MSFNYRYWLHSHDPLAEKARTLLDEATYTRLDTYVNGVQTGHMLMHTQGLEPDDGAALLVSMSIPVPANQAAAENLLANAIIENASRETILLFGLGMGALLHAMPDWLEAQQHAVAHDIIELVSQGFATEPPPGSANWN